MIPRSEQRNAGSAWKRVIPALVLVAFLASGAGQANPNDRLLALGRHLAQECTSCHGIERAGNGIPSIIGLDAEYFVAMIELYRSGQRSNPAMVSVAQSLDDQQIKALSLYFESLSKPVPARR